MKLLYQRGGENMEGTEAALQFPQSEIKMKRWRVFFGTARWPESITQIWLSGNCQWCLIIIHIEFDQ